MSPVRGVDNLYEADWDASSLEPGSFATLKVKANGISSYSVSVQIIKEEQKARLACSYPTEMRSCLQGRAFTIRLSTFGTIGLQPGILASQWKDVEVDTE